MRTAKEILLEEFKKDKSVRNIVFNKDLNITHLSTQLEPLSFGQENNNRIILEEVDWQGCNDKDTKIHILDLMTFNEFLTHISIDDTNWYYEIKE